MNKIERAIADCKQHIKHLENEKTLIYAELNAYRKQLDNLEAIERNKSIPHDNTMDKLVQAYTEKTLPIVNEIPCNEAYITTTHPNGTTSTTTNDL